MSIEDRLDSFPEPWKPEPGEKLVGTVSELDTLASKFGGDYPLVVVTTDDDQEVAFHAFHTVAKSELARKRPEVGDKIGIAYFGRDDKVDYERYRIIVERSKPTEAPAVDWSKVAQSAEQEIAEQDSLDEAWVPPTKEHHLEPPTR